MHRPKFHQRFITCGVDVTIRRPSAFRGYAPPLSPPLRRCIFDGDYRARQELKHIYAGASNFSQLARCLLRLVEIHGYPALRGMYVSVGAVCWEVGEKGPAERGGQRGREREKKYGAGSFWNVYRVPLDRESWDLRCPEGWHIRMIKFLGFFLVGQRESGSIDYFLQIFQ